jgi:hypothetical protein
VTDFLLVNALINTAVITAMSPEDFHGKGEGLGILASIRQNPDTQDARTLIHQLRGILG